MTPKKLKKILTAIFFISSIFPIFCYEAELAICSVGLIACILGLVYAFTMMGYSESKYA